MQLSRYLRLLQRWWWLLALGALIGGGTAYGIGQLKTPIYPAEATLLVNQTQTPGILMGASVGLLVAGALVRFYELPG